MFAVYNITMQWQIQAKENEFSVLNTILRFQHYIKQKGMQVTLLILLDNIQERYRKRGGIPWKT